MYLVALGPRALEGQEAGPDLLELKESQGLLVCLEEMDNLVHRGHKVHQASVVQLDQLGSKDQEDCQDLWGPQGQLDHRGNQESHIIVQ